MLLTPKLIFSSVLTHEMIHSMNVGHSYSDRKVRVGLFFQHFGLCFLDMQNI